MLLLPTVAFFAQESTTLLAKLYVTSFLLNVKFWQMDHIVDSATFLQRMHIAGHMCTSGLTTDSKTEFSMSGFVHNQNMLPIWPQFGLCVDTCCANVQKWPEFHFQSIFYPKICLFPIRQQISVALPPRFMHLMSINCFCHSKFSEPGASRGEDDHFSTKPQKAHPWLISHVLSLYACRSVHGIFCR